MVIRYFKLGWIETLVGVLAPHLLGRFFWEGSSEGGTSTDLEASNQPEGSPKLVIPLTNPRNVGSRIKDKSHCRSTARDPEDDELVYICIFDHKNNSWRLRHARMDKDNESKPSIELDSAVNSSNNHNGSIVSDDTARTCPRNMDKALFQALRKKLLERSTQGFWKWISWFSITRDIESQL
jgi:hypothetical protein